MKFRNPLAALLAATLLVTVAGCSKQADDAPVAENIEQIAEEEVVTEVAEIRVIEITPGLNARVLREGDGEVAEAGDTVVVHYTGWLYDESAENMRGQKFDSSVDRGEHFDFPLGGGRVIKGWDQGVAGMAIGEVRELTIAPELAYGERGFPDVIPPNTTLVFEVELFELRN